MSDTHTPPAAPTGITMAKWSNYAQRVDIISDIIVGLFTELAANPMIVAAAGREFVDSLTEASDRIKTLREEGQNV